MSTNSTGGPPPDTNTPPADTNTPPSDPPTTNNPPTPTPTPTTPTPPPPPTTSSTPPPPPPPPTTSSTTRPDPPPSTSSTPPPPETTPGPPSSSAPDNGPDTSTEVVTRTITRPTDGAPQDPAPTSSTTTTGVPGIGAGGDGNTGEGGGLSNNGKIAIAVVVPIVAVALLVVAGIFFWRKRKQRKDAEEQRRKEVEDYGYNPNADPTIPAVAAGYDGRDDESAGYRGWGSTTIAGSTARKTSTTMSGGAPYSDAASPTRGAVSDTRSGEPLMHEVPSSPEGEILGAMGPSAANNRGDVHRGPSNASSSYSAAARSDGSGEGPIGMAYSGPNQYYDQYGSGNPYSEQPPNPQGGGSPIIRDVTARRNTRIENPAHYPQQTAGISQNF
ncbi:hypothetical protein QBC40DRAFT_107519 [Triangularia verruculosa]|uniref:Uncharacterized protein n=1 Tax=Triangularia verruculosa TaxID=2587418 RepID=A0AAN7AS83_9PEZI|nr:hypothetical protein QBC40DRAFT_107519 [Triangularia verruculosa]